MPMNFRKYLKEHPDVIETVNRIAMTKDSTFEKIAKDISEYLKDIDVSGETIRKYTRDALGRKTDQSKNCFKNKNIDIENEINYCDTDGLDVFKNQLVNLERNRYDRALARQQMYYQFVGKVISTLPLPTFEPIDNSYVDDFKKEYLLCLADIHYGATFKSENNEYSRDEVKYRLEFLQDKVIDWCKRNSVSHLHIASLGDTLQGLLRISDLKLNDSAVVCCVVEISRLIAMFLNNLSQYITIDYYHVMSANHTQTRPIGTKASELANEDLEYVIGNYVKDLLSNNHNINIHLSEEGKNYLDVDILNFNVVFTHGHTIKNLENAIKDISMLKRQFIDYLIVGHYHGGKEMTSYEGICHDGEVLVCPSFIGSDPYSDSLLKGTKGSVKLYGFDEVYGHTETYKFILN